MEQPRRLTPSLGPAGEPYCLSSPGLSCLLFPALPCPATCCQSAGNQLPAPALSRFSQSIPRLGVGPRSCLPGVSRATKKAGRRQTADGRRQALSDMEPQRGPSPAKTTHLTTLRRGGLGGRQGQRELGLHSACQTEQLDCLPQLSRTGTPSASPQSIARPKGSVHRPCILYLVAGEPMERVA